MPRISALFAAAFFARAVRSCGDNFLAADFPPFRPSSLKNSSTSAGSLGIHFVVVLSSVSLPRLHAEFLLILDSSGAVVIFLFSLPGKLNRKETKEAYLAICQRLHREDSGVSTPIEMFFFDLMITLQLRALTTADVKNKLTELEENWEFSVCAAQKFDEEHKGLVTARAKDDGNENALLAKGLSQRKPCAVGFMHRLCASKKHSIRSSVF